MKLSDLFEMVTHNPDLQLNFAEFIMLMSDSEGIGTTSCCCCCCCI